MKSIGAVIVAAGYGSCRVVDGKPFPKVLETIGGVPMIVLIATMLKSLALSHVAVVVNPIFEKLIRLVLEKAGFSGEFFIQPERTGSAEAVALALPTFLGRGVSHILITYADMPLWSSKTLECLLKLHEARHPIVSMVSVHLNGNHPKELDRYGRILRYPDGGIKQVVEVNEATEAILALSRTVNPSLWVWDALWLQENIFRIPPKQKQDEYRAERHLPVLIQWANGNVAELPLANPCEALGVSNVAELEQVRHIYDPI